MKDSKKTKNQNNNKNKKDEEHRIKLIKDNLKCSISFSNYIINNSIILGYSILQNKNANKIELNPIPLLISYNEFINEIEDFYSYITYLNSPKDNYFNYWIPIFIFI